jgi:hypothetical protein
MPELDWLGPTWPESNWPDWVPQSIRDQVVEFWGPFSRRHPAEWVQNCEDAIKRYGAPAFGAEAALPLFSKYNETWIYAAGRYVHAWNNIGRIVHSDGTFSYVWLPGHGDPLEPRVSIATAIPLTEVGLFMAAHVTGREV